MTITQTAWPETCPDWCTTSHGGQDHPDDRYHAGDSSYIETSIEYSGEGPIMVYRRQHVGALVSVVELTVPGTTTLLMPSEARELAATLTTLAERAEPAS